MSKNISVKSQEFFKKIDPVGGRAKIFKIEIKYQKFVSISQT
jgi:hypothetical protein